jgi:hypothetical protein
MIADFYAIVLMAAMKKFVSITALFLTFSALAVAQARFGPGSAYLNHTDAAELEAAAGSAPPDEADYKPQLKRPIRYRQPSVRCQDGTVSYSRQNVCAGRGGPR